MCAQVNTADVQKREGQFTYLEGEEYVFMDTESYEETRLKKDDWAQFLKVGACGGGGGGLMCPSPIGGGWRWRWGEGRG